ncbi:MAG: 16S rRNA (uracil(1498)-N(3))-methyltransferase [Rickettsiales bacterium]|jgi:16S rRNA (uracil1498-N3)-methyltransferase|nr:16S rRNA (uracil(1498)-N(3))-methyltransferase [Rickettsiales bacterium]
MKNIPRIYINHALEVGGTYPLPGDAAHYLTRVMRADEFLAFGGGAEYCAKIINKNSYFVSRITDHADPGGNITLAFAPIKKTDDLINMATQLGVARFQPVITRFAIARHTNWARMKKIAIEAAEQSGRNSVPEFLPEITLDEFIGKTPEFCFADERFAHDFHNESRITDNGRVCVLVGPEGGFSDDEFAMLDKSGGTPLGLGKTILRAELAAAVAIVKCREL